MDFLKRRAPYGAPALGIFCRLRVLFPVESFLRAASTGSDRFKWGWRHANEPCASSVGHFEAA
jgi:hypothetical protein